jgi:hypothetical protein
MDLVAQHRDLRMAFEPGDKTAEFGALHDTADRKAPNTAALYQPYRTLSIKPRKNVPQLSSVKPGKKMLKAE